MRIIRFIFDSIIDLLGVFFFFFWPEMQALS